MKKSNIAASMRRPQKKSRIFQNQAFESPWGDTRVFVVPDHRESFSRPRLTISKNTNVETIKC